MAYFLRNTASTISVTPISMAAGGEGQCYEIKGRPNESVKIYSHPVPDDLEDRLTYQINNPPVTILPQVAWPMDIVEDGCVAGVGYLQSHFGPPYDPVTDASSLTIRPRWVTGPVLRRYAYEVAHILAELHAYGYLFPDLHGEQLLVAKGRPAVLIDMGSCQFHDGATLFPCIKVRPETQAPEFLDSQNWAEVADRRDEYTDAWSLAVLVFQLAMGCHPFDGVYRGPGPIPSRIERTKKGLFPFDQQCQQCQPPAAAPPYRHVPQELRDLFYRCFVNGHLEANRKIRPTAAEWADTLRHCPELTIAPLTSPIPNVRVSLPSRVSSVTAWAKTWGERVARAFPNLWLIAGPVVLACLLLVVGIITGIHRLPDYSPQGQPTSDDVEAVSVPPIYETLPSRDPYSPDVEPILKRFRARISSSRKETER